MTTRDETAKDPVTREEIDEIEDLIQQQQELIAENNKLIRKIYRSNTWAFWLRILWLAVFLGLPVIVYYYLLAPYYQSLDTAFQYFGIELPDIPFGNDGEQKD